MFEVGKTYKHREGFLYKCLFVYDDQAVFLASSDNKLYTLDKGELCYYTEHKEPLTKVAIVLRAKYSGKVFIYDTLFEDKEQADKFVLNKASGYEFVDFFEVEYPNA